MGWGDRTIDRMGGDNDVTDDGLQDTTTATAFMMTMTDNRDFSEGPLRALKVGEAGSEGLVRPLCAARRGVNDTTKVSDRSVGW